MRKALFLLYRLKFAVGTAGQHNSFTDIASDLSSLVSISEADFPDQRGWKRLGGKMVRLRKSGLD